MIDLTDNPNLAMLEIVARMLGELCGSLVFVGGCATGLLVTTVRSHQIRATQDVDVVAEVTTVGDYHHVESQLTSRGFKHDISSEAPICRWVGGGVTLDLMPSAPGVLSFHNRWYPLAVSSAESFQLPSGKDIRLIAAPVFVGTKLEAFRNRGEGDFLTSHDLEDIVTVIDGRPELIEEVRRAPEDLQAYIAVAIGLLTETSGFLDALAGHLPGDRASQARLPGLIDRITALAEVGKISI
jgi:hypothetical protein